METRQEWAGLTRNLQEFILAFRTALSSVRGESKRRKLTTHKARLVTIAARGANGPLLFAELERRKNLAYLNYARGQVR